jgi:hypothetical protein
MVHPSKSLQRHMAVSRTVLTKDSVQLSLPHGGMAVLDSLSKIA